MTLGNKEVIMEHDGLPISIVILFLGVILGTMSFVGLITVLIFTA